MSVRWYAVMTKPRGEYGLHRDLQAQGYRTLWLHYAGTIRHARRVLGVLKPYFPRYLFVGLTVGQSLGPVRENRRAAGIVHSDDGPLEIPVSVIDELASRGDAWGKIGILAPDQRRLIEEGAAVRIVTGPLEGLLATVALDTGLEVRVILEMFKGRIEARLPPRAVEVISPAGGLVPANRSDLADFRRVLTRP